MFYINLGERHNNIMGITPSIFLIYIVNWHLVYKELLQNHHYTVRIQHNL
jgi:hypothetical protein